VNFAFNYRGKQNSVNKAGASDARYQGILSNQNKIGEQSWNAA